MNRYLAAFYHWLGSHRLMTIVLIGCVASLTIWGVCVSLAIQESASLKREIATIERLRGRGGEVMLTLPVTTKWQWALGRRQGEMHRAAILDFVDSELGDEDLASLSNLPYLRCLHVLDSIVDESAIRHLASVPQLGQLALTGPEIGDSHLAHIGGLEHLEILYLESTGITDQGIAELVTLTGLHELVVANTDISGLGLRELAKIKSLRMVDLRWTSVSGEAVEAFQTNNPNVQVEY